MYCVIEACFLRRLSGFCSAFAVYACQSISAHVSCTVSRRLPASNYGLWRKENLFGNGHFSTDIPSVHARLLCVNEKCFQVPRVVRGCQIALRIKSQRGSLANWPWRWTAPVFQSWIILTRHPTKVINSIKFTVSRHLQFLLFVFSDALVVSWLQRFLITPTTKKCRDKRTYQPYFTRLPSLESLRHDLSMAQSLMRPSTTNWILSAAPLVGTTHRLRSTHLHYGCVHFSRCDECSIQGGHSSWVQGRKTTN